MSGHSKWSTIKRKKGALDAQRGKIFTKISKQISIAAQQGGGDADTNFSLRLAVDRAKSANMPKDNIERAIKRGVGELEGEQIEEISYEGYGPDGVAIIIDSMTDNKNRTVSEVRHILTVHGGSLGADGSVAWQFDIQGLVTVRCQKRKEAEQFGKEDILENVDSEEVLMEMLEIDGVIDVVEVGVEVDDSEVDGLEVYCTKENLKSVQDEIEKIGYIVESSEIVKKAKSIVAVDEEVRTKIQNLIEALEDYDDVQSVWANIDLDNN